MGEYKQNILNVSSGYYSEIEQFTLKNKLQPLIQIDGDVTDISNIYIIVENLRLLLYHHSYDSCYIKQIFHKRFSH